MKLRDETHPVIVLVAIINQLYMCSMNVQCVWPNVVTNIVVMNTGIILFIDLFTVKSVQWQLYNNEAIV